MNKPFVSIPLYRLAPSFITLLGLCLGITSIRYAFDEKWQIAVGLIVIAGFLDGIDGRLARMLNATSGFGAQLDSLADVISFGVAPAVVMYLWLLHYIPYKGVGWAVVLFYVACSAIRLARFNVSLEDEFTEKNKSKNYFVGVPITSAAGLALLPIMISFELADNIFSWWFVAIYLPIIGLLMISRIPTFSGKAIHIKREYVSLTFLSMALLMAGLITEPWITVPIMGVIYMLMIPVSWYFHRQSNDNAAKLEKL